MENKKQRYQVKTFEGDIHTVDLSLKEAKELVENLEKIFKQDYVIHLYEVPRLTPWHDRPLNQGISGGIDGWEDMFSY